MRCFSVAVSYCTIIVPVKSIAILFQSLCIGIPGMLVNNVLLHLT